MAGEILPDNEVSGTFGPGDFRYLVIAPRVGDLYLLGLLDKYIPVSRRQFKEISRAPGAVNIALELPTGRSYTLVISGPERVLAEGRGISDIAVERQLGLTLIGFRVETPVCRLILRV